MNPTRPISVHVPARRALPRNLSARAKALGNLLVADAPTHMWDTLDDNQLAALLDDMAAALAAAPAGKVWHWHASPAGHGLGHLLVRAPAQPFVSDSLAMAVHRAGAEVLGMAHPLLQTKGQPDMLLVYLAHSPLDTPRGDALRRELARVVALAQRAVEDYPAMVARLDDAAAVCAGKGETTAFLRWLTEGNFIFLGYRRYTLKPHGKTATVQADASSGLGILHATLASSTVAGATPLERLGGSLADYMTDDTCLQLSKTPDESPLHRAAPMDYVGIWERDAAGRALTEHRFVGLYSSQAYTRGVRDIPLLRQTLERVRSASRWPAGSDNHRALVNVLETFPRDELFLMRDSELLELGEAMVLARKQQADVAVMVRPSPREQAVSVYMLAPMSRYNSHVREHIRSLLMDKLDGLSTSYKVEMSDGDLSRIFFKVRVGTMPTPAQEAALAEAIRQLVRGWHDTVRQRLCEHLGPVAGHRAAALLSPAHGSAAYTEATPVEQAVDDARTALELASAGTPFAVRFSSHADGVRVRIFHRGGPLALAHLMPVLRSFGLDAITEQSFALTSGDAPVWLHVFACAPLAETPATATHALIEQAMAACLAGGRITDSLNSLLPKGLPLEAVDVLRALAAYLQQTGPRFIASTSRKVLREHPALARHVWQSFEARHQPEMDDAARGRRLRALARSGATVLDALPDAEADRVGRALLAVVDASLRTNLWQGRGAALAFKVDSTQLALLPQPRPWREIFVFAPEVEGIHLRGGPVARGGLRHSDRLTDYRTEVLALQTAQMRKNTIIVPQGAKGGFVVKAPLPTERAAAQQLVRACYQRYIEALLSLTDTRAGSSVLPPHKVVRHDGDDPYLVVAADKGTATFSDLANATAMAADFWPAPRGKAKVSKGFWLGDAFASGGKDGYDHKAMGITARGAWLSVLHHARALDIVPAPKRPLTMAGIGDMGGDVFGNGLLMDKHVKLLAAFNHKHIFLDPAPDAAASYAERQRLFAGVAGWDSYNPKLISKGGGVFERSAKRIPLSKEVQAMLGLGKAEAAPSEVIQAILRAKVDCLWNGGIGTYIKASHESHADAADRANDEVRVNASDVQARIIGEGGNLGITPAGRVELAVAGVRLNTDAVDNSAGVSASDHEVNLKILFELAKQRGELTEPQRLKLLPQLTDAVAELVLHDNRLQNAVIAMEEAGDAAHHRALLRWQQELLRRGHVDMAVDTLPTAEVLKQRPSHRYTRPELASLLAGTKAALRERVAGKLDYASPLASELLRDYFPATVSKRFGPLLAQHPLAHEIIDTMVTNMVVNRCGLLMGQHLQADAGCGPDDAIHAILVAIGLLDVRRLWQQLDDAAAGLPMPTQLAIAQRVQTSVATLAGWVLGHGVPVQVAFWLERLHAACQQGFSLLPKLLPPSTRHDVDGWEADWRAQGVPAAMAQRLALLSAGSVVPQAALLASEGGHKLAAVLEHYLMLGERLQLPALIRHIRTLQGDDRWQRQAVQAMVREVMARQNRLAACLLARKRSTPDWLDSCGESCQRYHALAREFLRTREPSMSLLTVLLGRLRELEA